MPHSRSTPINNRYDIRTLLGIEDIGSGYFICLKNRCRNQIGRHSQADASRLLNLIDKSHNQEELRDLLADLASCCLCDGPHKDEWERISQTWFGLLCKRPSRNAFVSSASNHARRPSRTHPSHPIQREQQAMREQMERYQQTIRAHIHLLKQHTQLLLRDQAQRHQGSRTHSPRQQSHHHDHDRHHRYHQQAQPNDDSTSALEQARQDRSNLESICHRLEQQISDMEEVARDLFEQLQASIDDDDDDNADEDMNSEFSSPSEEANSYPFYSREDLTCSICQEGLLDPRETPCGHVFCRECIVRWLGSNGRGCPLDRQPMTVEDLRGVRVTEMVGFE